MNLERAVELLKRADSESKIAGLRHLPVEVINNDGIMDLVLDALTGDEPDTRYAAIQVLKKAGLGGQDLAAAIPLLMAVSEDARFPSHLSKAKNTALSIGLPWSTVRQAAASSEELRRTEEVRVSAARRRSASNFPQARRDHASVIFSQLLRAGLTCSV